MGLMDRPIRVLFLTHNYPRRAGDSSGVFLHMLAKSLVPHGIQPIVLAPHDAGLPEQEEVDGIRIVRFRYENDERRETLAYSGNMLAAGRSLPGLFRLWRFRERFADAALRVLRDEPIDLLWAHWLIPAGDILAKIQRHHNIPSLLSSHGTDIAVLRKHKRRFSKYSFIRKLSLFEIPEVAAWTVVSSFLRDQLLSVDRELADVVKIMPLPHDETIFHRDSRITRGHSRIVAITRFTEQKRVGQLIEAMRLVRDSHPSARLDIWGTGPLQEVIESQIRVLGLESAVAIHQPVPQRELADLYRSAGMVVLNSVDEGFGLALSEAMLCGAPVVGVRSGGITDIIADGQSGLLAEPDDPADLARVILKMLGDPSLRERLAEAGHTAAVSQYASGPLSAEYARLIRNALLH